MTVSSREQVFHAGKRGGSSESGKEEMDEGFLFISGLKEDLDVE